MLTDSPKIFYPQSHFIQVIFMKSNSFCSISMPIITAHKSSELELIIENGPWPYFSQKTEESWVFGTLANHISFPGFIRFHFLRVAVALGTTSSRLFDAWCVDRFGVRGSPETGQLFSDRKIVYYWNFGWPKRSHLQHFDHKEELSECQLPGKLIRISYFSYRLLASAWFSKLCYLNEVRKIWCDRLDSEEVSCQTNYISW